MRTAFKSSILILLAACGGGSTAGTSSDGGTNPSPDGGSSPCDPVAPADGMTLHVNPIGGDDALATGSGAEGGQPNAQCAFHSITRAMQAAAAAGKLRMGVVVDVAATAGAGTGEVFPIALPANTTLSAATGATVTVQVGSGAGFQMSHEGSAIHGITLDGQGSAAEGVVASGGTPLAPNALSGVEVKGFTSAGVRAEKTAILAVTGSSNVHDNGASTATAPGPAGLLAVDTAVVTVNASGATLQAPLQLSSNIGNGIEVRGQAQVHLSGELSTQVPGEGTLVIKGNTDAGVLVEQLLVAKGAAGPAGMTMTGFVSTLNGHYGMHLFGGSGVKVRLGYLSKNASHGVYIQTDPGFVSGGAGANDGNDLTRLDFGASGDLGHNVLQDAGSPNALKGLCLDLSAGGSTGGLLALQGNVFATGGTAVDCAQIAGALPATGDCAAQGPLGDVGRNPKNDFDVASCTVP